MIAVYLISIDGTLQTSSTSLPTFDDHKKQISEIVSNVTKDDILESDTFNLETEIYSSWQLLQMASKYIPKPMSKEVKCLLLHTSESTHLKNLWKSFIPNVDAIEIKGNHETMLSNENSPKIAKIILSQL